MTLAIRALALEDHAACVALWRATEGLGDAPSAAQLEAFLARNPGFSQVATADGRIVGAVLASFDGIRGMLYRAAVDRGHRRHGIGAALVEAVSARLRAAGAVRINLHVFASNTAAVGFWSAQGWSLYEGLVCMHRDLP